MKESLSHLPPFKGDEIQKVVEIIKEVANPLKVLLFGSYAKGQQVEHRYVENGILYEYKSDYDFLVVTREGAEKDYIMSDKVVNRARQITKLPVNLIIHTIGYVNEGLRIGQYFFTDIIKEGVLLYDSGEISFEHAKELSKEEQKEIAERYFEKWYEGAVNFLDFSKAAQKKLKDENKKLNDAAFLLHQATERFYYTILLVFTGYKPKTHNIEKLRQYAKPYSVELLQVFPEKGNEREEHLFDLLKRGYIDARYKDDYIITEDELQALIDKVESMKGVVERICKEKINTIE